MNSLNSILTQVHYPWKKANLSFTYDLCIAKTYKLFSFNLTMHVQLKQSRKNAIEFSVFRGHLEVSYGARRNTLVRDPLWLWKQEEDVTRSPKQEYQWPHKKNFICYKINFWTLFKRKLHWELHLIIKSVLDASLCSWSTLFSIAEDLQSRYFTMVPYLFVVYFKLM